MKLNDYLQQIAGLDKNDLASALMEDWYDELPLTNELLKVTVCLRLRIRQISDSNQSQHTKSSTSEPRTPKLQQISKQNWQLNC